MRNGVEARRRDLERVAGDVTNGDLGARAIVGERGPNVRRIGLPIEEDAKRCEAGQR